MKVSIITISYNSSKTIKETLDSVINQTYKNFQHIIIDGGSEDETLNICKKYLHIYKIISEKDKGVYDAFNKGLKIANGEIIGFLNSDDIFYDENSLKTIVSPILKLPFTPAYLLEMPSSVANIIWSFILHIMLPSNLKFPSFHFADCAKAPKLPKTIKTKARVFFILLLIYHSYQ